MYQNPLEMHRRRSIEICATRAPRGAFSSVRVYGAPLILVIILCIYHYFIKTICSVFFFVFAYADIEHTRACNNKLNVVSGMLVWTGTCVCVLSGMLQYYRADFAKFFSKFTRPHKLTLRLIFTTHFFCWSFSSSLVVSRCGHFDVFH